MKQAKYDNTGSEASEPNRLDLRSHDVTEDKRRELLRLFPEARTEGGKIDFERLRLALGTVVDVGKERYGLTWPGKAECFQAVQTPSLGTLLPCREESVDFDTTENLIIEGDNLEVLKLLQKSYLGKVKMIYIDPPYNTGNDFIYPDDYSESLQTYLQYTGQVDAEGKKFGTNTETDGRFHSKWLSMMWPRLYMARNLLRDDGMLFVSCDDNEISNLRATLNEIFGEENFIATVIWQKVFSPKNSARHFSEDHDYIVAYARHADVWRPRLLPRTNEMEARYENPDGDLRGPWTSGDFSARNYYSEGTYAITCPSGREISGPPPGTYWRMKKDKFLELDRDGRIWWGKDGNGTPRLKRFLSEVKQGRVPQTFWPYEEVGHTQGAKKQLMEHVAFEQTDNVIDSIKPTGLIRRMLQLATEPSEVDVVLDFCAGSGSTGHAVFEQNEEDGGNRRFILVQLPEPLPQPETELRTIADITKERVRRVIKKLNESDTGQLSLERGKKQDRGFRVYKLAESSFKPWNADVPHDAEAVAQQLDLHVDHIREGRSTEDLLWEILLKSGFPLTTPIETLTLAGKTVHAAAGGEMLLCLDRALTLEVIRAIAEREPSRVVLLDAGFAGNDQLKANAAQIFKTKGVVSFRTV
ncbi:MAG: site-specific DNA-methyltransferase [Proteobacteria bacterium]|nr:MAG: site-specific DNA-methyltransferase [Pseudomonadota bacterium]